MPRPSPTPFPLTARCGCGLPGHLPLNGASTKLGQGHTSCRNGKRELTHLAAEN